MITFRSGLRRSGFTLVITLIMLVLAAVIVVALLTSASLDRLTATSYDQRYQAELAAQSGLEAAKKALSTDENGLPITQDDAFTVVRASASPTPSGPATEDTNPHYYYIAQFKGQSGGVKYFPLFSGGGAPQTYPSPSASATPSVTWAGTQAVAADGSNKNYPILFPTAPHSAWQKGANGIHTNWQALPTPTPFPGGSSGSNEQTRYTYWVEDLRGYVDANVAGNTDSSGSHVRPLGYDPKEIALFTLFNNSLTTDDGSTFASTIVGNHPNLFTRLSARLGGTLNKPDDIVCTSTLVANIPNDSEQIVIPIGLSYKSEGQPKTNLNQLIADIASGKTASDAAVTKIATAISTDLPKFSTLRKGSLDSSQDYNKTIAANIIDYGDTDSTPTIGSSYRGVDLMPFVVEYFDQFTWESTTAPSSPGGDYTVNIRVKTYVQLWNMFGLPIDSGTFHFNDIDHAGIDFQNGGAPTSFDVVTPQDSSADITFSGANKLQPNEFRAVLVTNKLYTFDTGGSTPPTKSIHIGKKGTPTDWDEQSTYEVYWNGQLYDRPGTLNSTNSVNIKRRAFSLSKVGDINMEGTLPGLRYTNASGSPYNLGDPRSSYYIQSGQYATDYSQDSAWGGRIYMKTLAPSWIAGDSRPAGWPDSGHNSQPGTLPTSDSQDPTTIGQQALQTGKAPARISNRSDGRIYSVTELSYIYDPFQFDPFSTANAPTSSSDLDTKWRNAWKNSFNTAKGNDGPSYGSHSTLRIGRPEWKDFDKDGSRAWQLVDIFSAGDPADSTTTGATSKQISTRGKVNINTASREVLRTLGAGIKIGDLNLGDVDQAIQPATVYGPSSSLAADAFADAVINSRNVQPFVSTSQLAQLAATDKNNVSNQPFFGNPDQWPANGPTEWNDAASEQYFAKIYNYTTTRSRNFRVFVTGQVFIPASGSNPERVIATANKVYEVFLNPSRDSSGVITSQICQVTFQADVP